MARLSSRGLAARQEMSERPSIQTRRLTLRPFDAGDAEVVARLCGERDIASTTLLIPHPYALADAHKWIAGHQAAFDAGQAVHFAVCLRDHGELVGAITLMLQPEHDRAELGYWIGVPYWGNGYASEAARAVVGYAFANLRYNRVYAHHFTRNPASGRVLQKIGMRCDGRLRAHVKKWGIYEDCDFFGILRAEWEADARAANNPR